MTPNSPLTQNHNEVQPMIPFWQAHSPAEIALETMLDAVWCIAWLIGLCVATVQHFTAPAPPQVERFTIRGRQYVVMNLRSPLLSNTVNIR
jgi:hypothetical protein